MFNPQFLSIIVESNRAVYNKEMEGKSINTLSGSQRGAKRGISRKRPRISQSGYDHNIMNKLGSLPFGGYNHDSRT